MSRRVLVFLIILLIGLAFLGILSINSRKMEQELSMDAQVNTLTSEPSSQVIQKNEKVQDDKGVCQSDSDCSENMKCVEETQCPPCLDDDPYATCTCITSKTCQYDFGPCTSPDHLDVNTGTPFKPGISEARKYFNKHGFKVIEEQTRIIGENNAYYVVQIPAGATTNTDWPTKLKGDGFSDVTYHQIIGCDEISN